ncbi:MAG: hypothetical protein JXE07_01740 [Candidatus Aminicenantes bacterium]|nr:hypothetical protein [Candidatus Aminicenantes bacterium]
MRTAERPPAHALFEVEPENVILSAVKKEPGYVSRATNLRLSEVCGRKTEVRVGLPGSVDALETDLIERLLAKIEMDGKILRIKMKPFEIKTIRMVPRPRRTE